MIFTSVKGHIMTMDFPDSYHNWNGCDPFQLFDAPIQKTIPTVISFYS